MIANLEVKYGSIRLLSVHDNCPGLLLLNLKKCLNLYSSNKRFVSSISSNKLP